MELVLSMRNLEMDEIWLVCEGAHGLRNFKRDNVYEDFLQVSGKTVKAVV